MCVFLTVEMILNFRFTRQFRVLFVIALATAFSCGQLAWAKNWSGPTGEWHNAANWEPSGVPAAGEAVTVSVANAVISLTNETADLGAFTMTAGKLVFSNWLTRLIATNVTISGGTVTVANAFSETDMSNRVWIVCSNDFTLTAPGQIEVSGLGYATATGPGKGTPFTGTYGGGGGHGGKGAVGYNNGGPAYGNLTAPETPGSGGGGTNLGGRGGGVVRIEAGSTATVSGSIRANGQTAPYSGGGGAGGSIWIKAGTLTGSTNGLLQASGGSSGHYLGGDGGGGRIAVTGGTVSNPLLIRFTTATGGLTLVAPYAANLGSLADWGTVYIADTNLFAGMPQNNQFTKAVLQVGSATNWTVSQLTLTNNSFRLMPAGFLLTVAGNLAIATNAELGVNGSIECGGDLILTNNGLLTVYSGPTNETISYGGLVNVASNVLISGNNSWLRPHADPVNGGGVLLRMQNLVIAHTNAGINAVGRGFGPGQGPGKGVPSGQYSGAGGYGGEGGRGVNSLGGPTNGSLYAPMWPGSGGGARTAGQDVTNGTGYGGGFIHVEATGNVILDGQIIAKGGKSRGANTYGAGGSGGAILIVCRALTGSASALLSADGGDSGYTRTGSGGGGRIAVWYGPTMPDAYTISLKAGVVPSRVVVSNSLESFAGTINVTNGVITGPISPATNGLPGTVVFLQYLPPPSGTLIFVR